MSLRDRFNVWAAAHPRQFAALIFALAFVIVGGLLAAVTAIVFAIGGVAVGWYHYAIVAVAAALAALAPARDAYDQHPATAPTGGEAT